MQKLGYKTGSAVLHVLIRETRTGLVKEIPEIVATHEWMSLVTPEITDNDKLKVKDGSEIVIKLTNADEPRVLKVARLIRNSFQLSLTPRYNAALTIGAILYDPDTTGQASLCTASRDLALRDYRATENRIRFENLTGG